jgi:hypothetical protein
MRRRQGQGCSASWRVWFAHAIESLAESRLKQRKRLGLLPAALGSFEPKHMEESPTAVVAKLNLPRDKLDEPLVVLDVEVDD